jgi:hypothetical protein
MSLPGLPAGSTIQSPAKSEALAGNVSGAIGNATARGLDLFNISPPQLILGGAFALAALVLWVKLKR